jgi:hypothetical protein
MLNYHQQLEGPPSSLPTLIAGAIQIKDPKQHAQGLINKRRLSPKARHRPNRRKIDLTTTGLNSEAGKKAMQSIDVQCISYWRE